MIKHIKVKAPPPSLSITMTERVIGGLLLTPENASQDAPFTAVEVVPLFCTEDLRERRFTEDKLKQATKCLNPNKAPGWDSVPPAVIKSIGTHDLVRMRTFLNTMLEFGVIPVRRKTARVTLIKQLGREPVKPEAYRPLCIIELKVRGCPRYLRRILQSYFQRRKITYLTKRQWRKRRMCMGVL